MFYDVYYHHVMNRFDGESLPRVYHSSTWQSMQFLLYAFLNFKILYFAVFCVNSDFIVLIGYDSIQYACLFRCYIFMQSKIVGLLFFSSSAFPCGLWGSAAPD